MGIFDSLFSTASEVNSRKTNELLNQDVEAIRKPAVNWNAILEEVDLETQRQETLTTKKFPFPEFNNSVDIKDSIKNFDVNEERPAFILEISFVNPYTVYFPNDVTWWPDDSFVAQACKNSDCIYFGINNFDDTFHIYPPDFSNIYTTWLHYLKYATPRIIALFKVLSAKFPGGLLCERQKEKYFSIVKEKIEFSKKSLSTSDHYRLSNQRDIKYYEEVLLNRTIVPFDIWKRLLGEFYKVCFLDSAYDESFFSYKYVKKFYDLSSRYCIGDSISGILTQQEKGGAIVNFEEFPAYLPTANMTDNLRKCLKQSFGKSFEFIIREINLKKIRITLACKKEKSDKQDMKHTSSADVEKLVKLLESQNQQIQKLQNELKNLKDQQNDERTNAANEKKYF